MAIPFMPFYVDDWLADVEHLDYTEQGAYFRLLCAMWKAGDRSENPTLPDDDAYVAKLLHVTVDQWRVWRAVLVDNPEGGVIRAQGGRLIQKRLCQEWKGAKEKHEKASEKASAAAKARWESEQKEQKGKNDAPSIAPSNACDDAYAMPSQNPELRTQNGEGRTTSQAVPVSSYAPEIVTLSPFGDGAAVPNPPNPAIQPNGRKGYPPGFERIWQAFPPERRTAKDKAAKAYAKARDKPPDDVLIARFEALRRTGQWRRGVIPLLATWLNEKRWLDDAPMPSGGKDFNETMDGFRQANPHLWEAITGQGEQTPQTEQGGLPPVRGPT